MGLRTPDAFFGGFPDFPDEDFANEGAEDHQAELDFKISGACTSLLRKRHQFFNNISNILR